MAGGRQEGSWPLHVCRSRRIFGNFDAPSEKFLTFAVNKNKGLNFIGKSLNLDPLPLVAMTTLVSNIQKLPEKFTRIVNKIRNLRK